MTTTSETQQYRLSRIVNAFTVSRPRLLKLRYPWGSSTSRVPWIPKQSIGRSWIFKLQSSEGYLFTSHSILAASSGLTPRLRTRRIGTFDTRKGWQVAKKRVGNFQRPLRQMAVDRLTQCENIVELAKRTRHQ